MKYFEKIEIKDLKNNDIIYIDYEGYGSYDHFIVKDEKWLNVFDLEKEIKIDDTKKFQLWKQNYHFISKANEWFKEGTEAYLEMDPKDMDWALFRGIREDENGIGEDGESCPFEEFKIIKI